MTARTETGRLITVNTGSSSVKAAVYNLSPAGRPLMHVEVERVNSPVAALRAFGSDGVLLVQRRLPDVGFKAALQEVVSVMAAQGFDGPAAVGHRIVHGGPDYNQPQLVTQDLLAALRRQVPIDPEHLPQALMGIETMQAAFPAAVQVATFDTAFHRHMPPVARFYGIPTNLAEDGVLRYGFHGLSYESIVSQLRDLGELPERGVLAHLGNGSSMVAIARGLGVDTTMGFSPTSGLVMGTRSGDIDPSAILYLIESRGFSPRALRKVLNRESGLLGLSGTSGDMRDLLAAASVDARAALAVDLYCYVARKFLASMTAALGGLDVLVFTGGIGEHGVEIRKRMCSELGFLGLSIDDDKNRTNAPVISRPGRVVVRVMHTDEEAAIARHTAEILSGKDEADRVHV